MQAARAVFYERGVANTRDRTGILVYVAVAEGVVRVLPDEGVRAALSDRELRELVASVERTGPARNAETLAIAIGALTETLAQALPRREDDVDELENVA